MFFDGGALILLRTQNLISSTKHAMNLLVKTKERFGAKSKGGSTRNKGGGGP